jgi:hypothetical protein
VNVCVRSERRDSVSECDEHEGEQKMREMGWERETRRCRRGDGEGETV